MSSINSNILDTAIESLVVQIVIAKACTYMKDTNVYIYTYIYI